MFMVLSLYAEVLCLFKKSPKAIFFCGYYCFLKRCFSFWFLSYSILVLSVALQVSFTKKNCLRWLFEETQNVINQELETALVKQQLKQSL